MLNNDSILLYKMINGDLIIGQHAKDYEKLAQRQAADMGLPAPDVLYLRDPVEINIDSEGAVLRRWNVLSKINVVSIQPQAVMYLDVPSELLVNKYLGLLKDYKEPVVEDEDPFAEYEASGNFH